MNLSRKLKRWNFVKAKTKSRIRKNYQNLNCLLKLVSTSDSLLAKTKTKVLYRSSSQQGTLTSMTTYKKKWIWTFDLFHNLLFNIINPSSNFTRLCYFLFISFLLNLPHVFEHQKDSPHSTTLQLFHFLSPNSQSFCCLYLRMMLDHSSRSNKLNFCILFSHFVA